MRLKILKYFIMSKQKNNSDYIATWIGKSNKIAQKDYKREIDREGDVFFWDDTKKGHATVGKYFCFINATSGIKEDIIISVHKILTITKKDDRLKEWSKHGYIKDVNYDTSKRSLLTIEKKCLKKIKWNEYAKDVGYIGVLRCTQPLRLSKLLEVKDEVENQVKSEIKIETKN
jgi:hypothetical protein